MENSCFIFAAMPINRILISPREGDYVIAADKGLENAERLAVMPDRIIGDFDSLGFYPKGENVCILPTHKDDTDVGFAIKTGMEMGFKSFYIYGAIGGRLDHTLANLQLSRYIAERGCRAVFIGDKEAFCSFSGKVGFKNARGRFSVFALSDECRGVSVSGAEYCLENSCLQGGFPLGVSNEFLPEAAESAIKTESGILTVIWEDNILPEFF